VTLELRTHFTCCIEGKGLVATLNHSSDALSNAQFLLEENNRTNMGQSWSGTDIGYPRIVLLLEPKPKDL